MTTANYSCPICGTPLILNNASGSKSIVCENNHMFDFAKEGYVNLLPVQLKKSLQPGDDKNMVMARRAFLELGHYDFLRQELVSTIKKYPHAKIADLGCGEGYYTDYVQNELAESETYGADISKSAVKYAAKRNKQVHYSVATNAHVPLHSGYLDVIINIFAPIVGEECKRVLTEHGKLITVNPGAKHLYELKAHIYDNVDEHQVPATPEGFELIDANTIEQTVELASQQDVLNLLDMTPFGWKIRPEKKQNLLDNLPIQITLSFTLSEYQVN